MIVFLSVGSLKYYAKEDPSKPLPLSGVDLKGEIPSLRDMSIWAKPGGGVWIRPLDDTSGER